MSISDFGASNLKSAPGSLFLISSPMGPLEKLPAEQVSFIQTASENGARLIFEEEREARRRWLQWGGPREIIPHFSFLNEHNRISQTKNLLQSLTNGKDVFLLSDQGTPGFCDPGQDLVLFSQLRGISVQCLNTPNSALKALVESGFTSSPVTIAGFLPRTPALFKTAMKKFLDRKETIVILETAYRRKFLKENLELFPEVLSRVSYWSFQQAYPDEQRFWGPYSSTIDSLPSGKKNFVLVLSGLDLIELKASIEGYH